MKKIISIILVIVCIMGTLAVPSMAANSLTFRDVTKEKLPWAYNEIMAMVDIGLFKGTVEPDKNGVGEFNPIGTMSRAEFITVVTRHLYGHILENMIAGEYWYSNNYDFAVTSGLITQDEMPRASMNEGISRQEMAMIMVRAAEKQGEEIPGGVSNSRIADYNTIGTYYRDYVKQCFAMGMIKGYDEVGTFGPHDTVTRAQGAVVLYRLVNADTRDPEVSTSTTVENGTTQKDGTNVNDYKTETGYNFDQMYADWAANQTPMTITYGEARYNRPAVAGDTYVKKDGTSIVLKVGPSGIVGEGQGVMADLGLVWGNVKNRDHVVHLNGSWRYDKTSVGDDQCKLASDGSRLHGQTYRVNKSTGEGHFVSEWHQIEQNEDYLKYVRGIDGEYDGQVSSDPLKLFVWDAAEQAWESNWI